MKQIYNEIKYFLISILIRLGFRESFWHIPFIKYGAPIVVAILFVGIAFYVGQDLWWLFAVIITVTNIAASALSEYLTRKKSVINDELYEKLVEKYLDLSINIANDNLSPQLNVVYDHILDGVARQVFNNDCRIAYYTLDEEESEEAQGIQQRLTKVSECKHPDRGALSTTISSTEDINKFNEVLQHMRRNLPRVYDDIRRRKHKEEMRNLNIDYETLSYKSFVRIPIGYQKNTGNSLGVLIIDSKHSCYFTDKNINYKIAKHIAHMIEFFQVDNWKSEGDAESVSIEMAKSI